MKGYVAIFLVALVAAWTAWMNQEIDLRLMENTESYYLPLVPSPSLTGERKRFEEGERRERVRDARKMAE